MSRKERVCFWGLVLTLAMLMGLVTCQVASGADDPAYASPQLERCIGATCKVVAEDGSTGTGVIYGTGVRQGRRYVVIATAAHIVRGAARVTVFVGRNAVRAVGTVIVQNRRTDAGCVIVPIEEFRGQPPRPVKMGPRRLRLLRGQALFSIGYPGGRGPSLMVARTTGYDERGYLEFSPWQELGRSGSPVFVLDESDEPMIVGIMSTRDSRDGRPGAKGQAITPDQLFGDGEQEPTAQPSPLATEPDRWYTQVCVGPNCQGDGSWSGGSGNPFSSAYRVLPYRQKNDQAIQQLQRAQAEERSPGTLPLPPVMPASPPVDLGPLSQRVTQLESVVNQHSQDLGKLQVIADKAVQLADAVAKRDGDFARDLAAARGEAADAKKAVGEALDEENPKGLFGRLKSRIETIKTEGLGAALAEAGWLKWGLIGLAVAVGYLFLKREGAKAAAGEPTVAQRVAAMTPTEVDDRIANRLAGVQASIHERLAELRGHVAGLAGKTPPPAPPAT